jgi:RNA polymerase sigma-70 factor (ECF subfamily)
MDSTEHTCWTMIHQAASGDAGQRDAFARRYSDVIRSYLAARWRHSVLYPQVDDAVQEVFVECYREDGALGRVSPDRPGGFRAYLYGVVRNVARRIESTRSRRREVQPDSMLEEQADSDGHLSQVFDRSWAQATMRDAAVRMAELAAEAGDDAQRRVELLRLRFQESLPIRDIAKRWKVDAEQLHRQYARARADFKVALMEVLGFYESGSKPDIEKEAARLLALLA